MRNALAVLSLLLLPTAMAAQTHAGHVPSPYAGLEGRAIKALSPEETEQLLAGEGMGLALAAELNGYPGPRHVLELADSLELTGEQRERMEALFAGMGEEARELGVRLVEAERRLDQAFAGGAIDDVALGELVGAIAHLRGELRRVHLAAHLRTVEILTLHQRHRYQELRGYGDGHGPGVRH